MPPRNANRLPKDIAQSLVDERIQKYITKHGNRQTYTDLHDNALREVLYDQERRLRALEEIFRAAPTLGGDRA